MERNITERLDKRVHWYQGTPEDEKVDRAIQRMLEKSLGMDDAVQIALLNNARLQEMYELLGISQADLVQAGLLRNPVFAGSARFPGGAASGTNVELEIIQDFLDIFMRPARKRFAEIEFEESKLRVSHAVLALAADVRREFYRLQGARQIAEMFRTVALVNEISLELASRLYDAGNIDELKLANKEALYELSSINLARSEGEVLSVREQLNTLMGLWGKGTLWEVAEDLPALPNAEIFLEHVESLAISNRLDLQASGKEVEALAQALGFSRNWRLLALAEAGPGAEREIDGEWVVGPALSIELPIFDRKQAKIARLESQLRQSENRLRALAVEIRSEVRSIRDRILLARQIAGHYRDTVIPIKERIVRLSQEQYNFMLIGQFELFAAKQNEVDAYREYIETIRDYWIARSDLERAIGGRLPSIAAMPLTSTLELIDSEKANQN